MALLNLAVNARDAMTGDGVIIIAAREECVAPAHGDGLQPGHYVCLSVTDTGEGMDEATLNRAAEPFFTTKGVGKGTGLGLSMIHGLAEQSGGRLVLKSSKGKGTTAELWLPAMEKEAQSGAPAQGAPSEPSPPTRPLVVLAVDDDFLVLMNTAAMLEDFGHKVFQAISGQEALDILARGEKIDLLIADQAMPNLTGTQLVDVVKADRPDLPIILATGYGELPPGSRTDLRRLAKPFRQQQLADAITEVMRKSG